MAERGGLYCSFFRNSLVFCHFIRKTSIFCRLRTSLSSLFRLSSALQSLQWTSKVLKKSNMSNKSGFLFWVYWPRKGFSIGSIAHIEIPNFRERALERRFANFPALFVLTTLHLF